MSRVRVRPGAQAASCSAPSSGRATMMAFAVGARMRAVHGSTATTGACCCGPAAALSCGAVASAAAAVGVLQALVQPEPASTTKLAGACRALAERMRLSRDRGAAPRAARAPQATVWRRSLRRLAAVSRRGLVGVKWDVCAGWPA